jgi:enoyl-CoA hydratase/carnithine racemase
VPPLTSWLTPAGVLIVTIDSPPINLYGEAMHDSLRDAVERAGKPDVSAVLFEARGRLFTAGIDLALLDRLADPELVQALFGEMIDLIHHVEALAVPTVFAAHALCLTWGFELALGCDLLVAAESASFGMVERRFALTPAMGGTQRVAARAGIARAREMVLTGALYPATTLAGWNVVNLVLPDQGFAGAARDYTAGLASGPTESHAAAKSILREYARGGLDAADHRTPEIAAALRDTDAHRRLVEEFLARGARHDGDR